MTCIATAPVSPRRAYLYDTLGRPTSRTLARQGATRNDVFNYNDRSELGLTVNAHTASITTVLSIST